MERSSTIPPFSPAAAVRVPLRGAGELQPAVFLDRDGVLNRDDGYIAQIDQFEFLPGVFAALRSLQQAGFALVVVTNQSGIGRGYYRDSDYMRLSAWMVEELSAQGVELAGVYHCPHAPEENCGCRKPAPGLILAAARELGLDLSNSWLVGDKPSDIEAAERAGVPNTVQVRSGQPLVGPQHARFVCDALADVPRIVEQNFVATPRAVRH